MTDALARCSRVAEEVGIAALIVDAKHEAAKAFYLHLPYGFKALPDKPLTLWLLLPSIRKLFPPGQSDEQPLRAATTSWWVTLRKFIRK